MIAGQTESASTHQAALMHPERRFSRRDILKFLGAASLTTLWPNALALPDVPLIVDAHLDLGWNMVGYGRDYTQSAYDIRAADKTAGKVMLGLPEWLQGRVALIFGVIYVMPRHLATSGQKSATYATPQEAYQWGWKMLEAVESLATRSSRFKMVRSAADLDAVLATWAPAAPEAGRQVGILLAMEGADPIQTPDDLETWYARGLRSIGLSWGKTRYAGSSSEPGGLSELGAQLLRAMKQRGMIFDTAHLAEQAFWEALKVWEGRFVYTHGIPRYFLPNPRALSDDQIKALAGRDGVMGISPYNAFYYRHRSDPAGLTITDVVNAIDYVCQLLGTAAHVAIGSDLDGGFGAESTPAGMDTTADLQLIPPALRARGFSEADINAITHDNWLRVVREALPTAPQG
jgi:membrane dipeptidase